MPFRVFLSYAQVPEDHKKRVADLASSLKAAGLAVVFDGDVTLPQGPLEGWPKWMMNQIEESDWVLVICNETYYRRFRGTEAQGIGLGARWEGAIIGQTLYTDGTMNRKFVPVLLDDDDQLAHIPEPLRGATWYRLPVELPKLAAALKQQSVPAPVVSVQRPGRPARPRQSRSTVLWACLSGALLLVFLLLWRTGRLGDFPTPREPSKVPQSASVQERISGRVQDEAGNPVAGAMVDVAGVASTTDSAGHFEITVPNDRLQPGLSLRITAQGYAPWHGQAVLGSNEVAVALSRP